MARRREWIWQAVAGFTVLTAACANGGTTGPATSGGSSGAGGDALCVGASDCEALNESCREGVCVNGKCESLPGNELGSCDDGLFCTTDDVCRQGMCAGSSPLSCPSSDGCHVATCSEETDSCVEVPGNEGAVCDDGDPCLLPGTCSAGACTGAQPIDCTVLSSPCAVAECDPAIGCIAVPANEGGACDDATTDFCTAGQCKAGLCETVVANEGIACDDGLFCTVGEACHAGACTGGVLQGCAPQSACWIATCDESIDACIQMPGNDGVSCDEGPPCTGGTTCLNGACLGGSAQNEGVRCDDGLACTSGELCVTGTCVATTGAVLYFSEDFASNARGWTLGPEWEIGPAKASSGGAFGADPATDHTATLDNGVAGVVIGGNASTQVHPYWYLESPSFDTSAAMGDVILSFHRWLNSDFAPYMNNAVEVWDGTSWVTLWESGPPPRVQDSPPVGSGWVFVQHDVTAYKSATMRVRFGVTVGSAPLTVGSWNVDDVVVADMACP